MSILDELKEALCQNIDQYADSFKDTEKTVPPVRANDIINLRQRIDQCTLASTLRQQMVDYTKHATKLGFFGRLFNTHFCPLFTSIEATLHTPKFRLIPILVTETQQLAEQNIRYQQQLAQISTFIQTVGVEELTNRINSSTQREERITALEKENEALSAQIVRLTEENKRLKKSHGPSSSHTQTHTSYMSLEEIRSMQGHTLFQPIGSPDRSRLTFFSEHTNNQGARLPKTLETSA